MLLHGILLYLLWYDRTPLRTSSATTVVDIRLVPATTSARPNTRPASSTPPPTPSSPLDEPAPRPAPASRPARPPRPATPRSKPPRKAVRPTRTSPPPSRPARTSPPSSRPAPTSPPPSRPARASAPPAKPAPPPPAHAGTPEQSAAPAPVTTHATPGETAAKESAGAAALRAHYLGELASAIARNRHYPRLSRRRREEGRVLVGFHIASDGHFEQVRVLESSGRPRLDRAALETVRRTSPFRPPPPTLNEADREIRLPVVFRLQ